MHVWPIIFDTSIWFLGFDQRSSFPSEGATVLSRYLHGYKKHDSGVQVMQYRHHLAVNAACSDILVSLMSITTIGMPVMSYYELLWFSFLMLDQWEHQCIFSSPSVEVSLGMILNSELPLKVPWALCPLVLSIDVHLVRWLAGLFETLYFLSLKLPNTY